MVGPVGDDLVHEGQGLEGCSLHHIDHHATYHSLKLLHFRQGFHHSTGDRSSERVAYYHYVFIGEALHQVLEGLYRLGLKGLNREVLVIMVFLGETVPLEVEGHQCAESFDLPCQRGEAEGRVACTVDAEEENASLTGPENRGALSTFANTSLR